MVEKIRSTIGKRVGQRMLHLEEIRRTISMSLGTAFGLVIGLAWNQVVQSAFAAAGIPLTAGTGVTWQSWMVFVLAAIFVTFICSIGIIVVARWSGKERRSPSQARER